MGPRYCATLWKKYWRHQRKLRRWTSVVALVLNVCIACSICLLVCFCLLKYCRGEIRVKWICRLVLLFTLYKINYYYYYYYTYNHCSCCCCYHYYYGIWQCNWLRHCGTSQKVWAQFQVGYTEFFIHLIRLAAVWALGFYLGSMT